MIEYKLEHDYIELIKLLKITRIAATGGHAKLLVDEGGVLVNDKSEHRKRAKIRIGDVVECMGTCIKVVG